MGVSPNLELTAAEFKRMQELVYRHAGIAIGDEKVAMLSNRLRKRLRVLGLESFTEYYQLLKSCSLGDEELASFLSTVSTNETYFFRNEGLWEYVGTDLIKHLCQMKEGQSPKRAAFWSAASSTGAEAYTLAMVLRSKLPKFDEWHVEIVGTDISQKVLDTAQSGSYQEYALQKMDLPARRRYFKHDEEANVFQLKDEIRKMVEFKFHNLRDAFKRNYFDVVFLRNVMMYFDYEMKKSVLANVFASMRPGALMITGDVDPLRDGSDLKDKSGLEYVRSNTYRKPIKESKTAALLHG
ncbi:MAG: protein-glutamate O-methyltransferase CheR [Planctomycetes bacterium]|nr:protein-glutamate O-methyltransferase CheR [Planctomycetota bacterium]